MKLRRFLIGADPEFLFGYTHEWTWQRVNATVFLQGENRLTNFIGTDGHASTAELRPRPSHNLGRILGDLAFALSMCHKRAAVEKQGLFAAPLIEGESLGGHIHLSFSVDDAAQVNLLRRGWYHDGTRLVTLGATTSLEDFTGLQECLYKVVIGNAVSPLLVTAQLDYLLLPLEYWLQPWYHRLQRNRSYGVGGDVMRIGHTMVPPSPGSSEVRWHLEYRRPSTWLQHPAVAFAYLGTAKIVLLNWEKIRENIRWPPDPVPPGPAKPDNERWFHVFSDRLSHLMTKTPTLTPDLHNYRETVLGLLREKRNEILNPTLPIDIEAWRRLVP